MDSEGPDKPPKPDLRIVPKGGAGGAGDASDRDHADEEHDAADEKVPSIRKLRKLERQARVRELLVCHLTAAEMARELKCGTATIERDVAEIRAEMQADLSLATVWDVAGECTRFYHTTQRTCWEIVRDKRAEHAAKISALNTAIKSQVEWVKQMQSLGMTPQAIQKVQMQHVLVDKLAALDEPTRRQLLALPKPAFRAAAGRLLGEDIVTQWLGPAEAEDAEYEIVEPNAN